MSSVPNEELLSGIGTCPSADESGYVSSSSGTWRVQRGEWCCSHCTDINPPTIDRCGNCNGHIHDVSPFQSDIKSIVDVIYTEADDIFIESMNLLNNSVLEAKKTIVDSFSHALLDNRLIERKVSPSMLGTLLPSIGQRETSAARVWSVNLSSSNIEFTTDMTEGYRQGSIGINPAVLVPVPFVSSYSLEITLVAAPMRQVSSFL